MNRIIRQISFLAIIALFTGCAHQLEIKNLQAYQNLSITPLAKSHTIGIVPSTEDVASKQLVRGIGNALNKYSATVLLPYYANSSRKADIIAQITIRPEYKGSGANFWINWPGFLIWTPAWNGYVYKANYDISISLTDAAGRKIDSWKMPIALNIRHAEIDRTWTEIGWFEVSLIPFVGGFVFMEYDPDVTPLLANAIEVPIGDYIAQDIVHRINNYVPPKK